MNLGLIKAIAAATSLTCYFIAWLTEALPRADVFVSISAIAALVWAVVIVVDLLDNRSNTNA